MKKFFSFVLMALVSVLQGWAYDFEVDGIYYTLTGTHTVSVDKGAYDYDGDLTIPASVSNGGHTYTVTAVADNAFKSMKVENVVLPEGLTTIGNSSFQSSTLKSITLPSTLSSMGTSAFRECKNLTAIALPDALKDVTEYSFYDCSMLKSISLSNYTKTIERYAFANTQIENVIVPSSVNVIGNFAFANNSSLKTLYIDNAPVVIGESAFYRCSSLENVELGNAVRELQCYDRVNYNYGVFESCSNLKKIVLPSSLMEVGICAFRNCSKLYDVQISNNIQEIKSYAFQNCAITQIELPSSLISISTSAFNGCPLSSIKFPSNLKTIARDAFRGCLFSEITIPNSVITIGQDGFADCKNLKKVKIEDAAIRMTGAFGGCSALTDVDLGKNVVELITGFQDYACFQGCSSLEKIILPNTLKTLPEYTFSGCTNLKDIILPNELISIGDGVFENCKGLKEINLPSSIQTIGSYAFNDCSQLYKILLPASLTSIGSFAFSGCNSLTCILIPESITNLGYNTFQSCSNLETVIFDNTVVEIKNSCFLNCTNLKNVELGKVTSIESAFNNCTKLESITIPNSVESISEAFIGCTSLKKIVIGTGTKTLNGSFQNCSKLTNVELKSKVLTSVGNNTFQNCRSLKKISLPASVTSIGQRAFEGCSVLSNVYMLPTTPPGINANTFSDYNTPTLHVPAEAKTAYTKADNWKNFTNVVVIGSEAKVSTEDYAALESLLMQAQTLYNSAVEGTEPGNYRTGAKAVLKAVIEEVEGRISATMLAEDAADCTELLNNAIQSFRNKQVKNDIQTNNTLSFASSLKAAAGAEFFLPIEMNNVDAITGVQFDLYLPEGLLLAQDEYGDYNIELSERTTVRRHSVASRVMPDGALRVVVASQQNATFTGNSGKLLTLALYPQSNMEQGDYDVELRNIILTDPQETRYAAPDMKSTITVSTYSMGDVNNDGYIDVADLAGVVCFILENAEANLIFNAADMDGNGVVEINDYSALVNVILAQEAPSAAMRRNAKSRADGQTVENNLTIGNAVENEENEITIPILMNNSTGICGFQCDLYLPDGLSVATDSFDDLLIDLGRTTTRRHSLSMQQLENGALRILCSSTTNALFSGNSGAVLNICINSNGILTDDYTISLKNIVMTDPQAKRYTSDDTQAVLSQDVVDGVSTISISQLRSGDIYNLNGQRLNKLQRGLNILEGKKILLK